MLAFTKFNLKEQKVVKSCKSLIKGSIKVGFQLLFLSNYLLKGVSSSKRNVKGTYQQLFNFLSQLLKAKKGAKGCWKEVTFFLMPGIVSCNFIFYRWNYCTNLCCSAVMGTLLTATKLVVVAGHIGICQPWQRARAEKIAEFSAEIYDYLSMSRVPLASAECKLRRGGHGGSQAMPNNLNWYSMIFLWLYENSDKFWQNWKDEDSGTRYTRHARQMEFC